MHSHNSGRIIAAGSVIYRYSNQFFIKRMRELGIAGCYPPYLVAVAHNEGANQEDISRHMHVDKSQVARITKKLIEGDFVKREADENDKRNYRLYLTDKGKKTLPKLRDLDEEFTDVLMRGMSSAQREKFVDLADMAAMNILRDKGIQPPDHNCAECRNKNCPDRQRVAGRKGQTK